MATKRIIPKIAVIVPAYNEESCIQGVIRDIVQQGKGYVPVVVNDGSRDETAKVAEATGQAIVLSLPLNLGIGGAVQTGFLYAERNGFDYAVQFDGDGQHNASEIASLLEPLLSNKADVVIGSRFSENKTGFKSTLYRRFGIKIFEIINSILIRQRITDNTSGFRAYNRRAISFLATYYPEDYPEPEAVILLGKNGFRIHEIFATMKERQGGRSSIVGLKTAYYMVKVSLAIAMTSLRRKLM